MIFFFDKNGAPIDVVTNRIFQNSNKANTIFFVYPVENQASIGAMFVNVAFTLPNGENKPQRVMKPLVLTSNTGLNGVIDLDGNKFFIWEYDLKSDVTSYAGTVTCQFFVTVSGELITTASSTFSVELGVPIIEPIETDSYQGLLDYFANVLVPSLGKTDLNLENGTGAFSVVQKTPLGEENEASMNGAYAGGKLSKSLSKRAFTHGNQVINWGNTALSFGQSSENKGNISLSQGVGYHNGGDLSVLIGGYIYNSDTPSWTVPTNAGGSASALFGSFIYNKASHSLISGYLLKNTVPTSVRLGIANEDKASNLFELGYGVEIDCNKNGSGNWTFVYNNETYIINYEGEIAVSIKCPDNTTRAVGSTFRTQLLDGSEICIGGTVKQPTVYKPRNIFEITKSGEVRNFGGVYFRTCRNNVGNRKSFFYLDGESAIWSVGDSKAQIYMKDNKVMVAGTLSATNAPVNPNDVVRLTELDAVKQTIETLHKNGFVVVGELPTASSLTLGRIFLIAQANGSTNDVFDEYITIQTDTNAYTWEKIGSTQFTLIVDSEFSLTSENPVQNKVITKAIGDIETALDNIIDIQNALIGGNS
jgi:hypothetical protein